eukprot:scaffold1057_cov187-Alexandrium_tamarense.AAC.3
MAGTKFKTHWPSFNLRQHPTSVAGTHRTQRHTAKILIISFPNVPTCESLPLVIISLSLRVAVGHAPSVRALALDLDLAEATSSST